MNEFDQILDKCMDDLASGASTLDECLLRYPEHAARLESVLQTAIMLEQGRNVKPSAAFRARTRAKLTLHMQANPRGNNRAAFTFWKFAAGLAVITLTLLATGTAYAQSAFPGDSFYQWKLASELAWRAVSPNPLATDIAIANRRIDEMNMFSNDPARRAQALQGYQEVVKRLESELDTETLNRILPLIEITQEPGEASEQPSFPPAITETATQQPEGVVTPLPPLPEPPVTIPKIIPTIQIPPPIP